MSTTNPARNRSSRRDQLLWLVGLAGLTYIVPFVIIFAVIVTVPVVSWARAFKIVGLSLNVAGAIVALSPRVMRTVEQIEAELAMTGGRYRLRRDTLIADMG